MDNSQDPANNQSSARSGSSVTSDSGESSSAISTPTRELAKNDRWRIVQRWVLKTGGTAAQGLLSQTHETQEEVLESAKAIVSKLDKLEDYQCSEGIRYQKVLYDFSVEYPSHRHAIGDALNDCGYAALTVKMLKTMNVLGIFKNDHIRVFTILVYATVCACSDASEKLAKSLAEAGAVRLLILNLEHKPYLSDMENENVYGVLEFSLGILHNIARSSDVRHYFKENKAAEVMMPFISQKDELLKALSMLILANIADEEDNKHLICDTGTIVQLVKWLKEATKKAGERRFTGFTAWELTQGLDKLAVNDTNKIKVTEAGALPVFLKMLQHDDPKEQEVTGNCLWTLAFDKKARDKIKEYEGLVPALEALAKGEHPAIKKAVEGALWIIKGENDPSTTTCPESAMKTKGHVFISYSWNEKDIVKQIREKLRIRGYKVWIDYEQMGGSTLQAMAEAVENAAVVLVGISEKYKESPNCRTEAEYMYQLRKDCIPLMLQKKYRPDGWLGAILGAKLYFNFGGKNLFYESIQGLLRELGGRIHFSRSMDSVDGPDAKAIEAAASTPVHSGNSLKVPNHPATSHESHNMTRDDVTQWLTRHELHGCIAPMAQLDGKLLWQLKVMKDEAPQCFFQLLNTKLDLSFVDLLKFTVALDELH